MKNIYKALAEFQQEVKPIHQSSKGYGYTYASLGSIFKVINPLLRNHGLGFTQLLNGDGLKTVIFHLESGESLESNMNIQQNVQLAKMNTFQVLGSAITYYRRYSISAALGLITDSDIDACGDEEEVKEFLTDKQFAKLQEKANVQLIPSYLDKFDSKPEQKKTLLQLIETFNLKE